jgi:hypothetical protein
MKFLVHSPGDGSVGIAGDDATLEYDVTPFAEPDRATIIAQIKDGLQKLFADVMDGNVHVWCPCQKCGGDGWVTGEDTHGAERPETCPRCNGKGEDDGSELE